MKVRIDPLDRLFSRYILARDKYCQRCGGLGGLQTSHFWGRARRSVRWDEDNACLLCFGCHMYFTAHPFEHTEWFGNRLGEDKFNMLLSRMRNTHPKPDKKLIEIYLRERIKEFRD